MAKAGYVSINGTARKVKSIYVSVNGVARKVKAAYVGVNGVARQWYQSGLPASSLSVSSSVYLNEGGSYVEYLVVNQGIPQNSSLYDASCNGTWLLRKDCHSNRKWKSIDVNTYANSDINTWLNGDFFNGLGTAEQASVKQVKIPYGVGNGSKNVMRGANGLPCKVFLLGGYELGWTTSSTTAFPIDGSRLDYFKSGDSASALDRRIANLNGSATYWWLRSPYLTYTTTAWNVFSNGAFNYNNASQSIAIRPALILPFTATFDPTTMRLIG